MYFYFSKYPIVAFFKALV